MGVFVTRFLQRSAFAVVPLFCLSARAAFIQGDLIVVRVNGITDNAQSLTLLDYNVSGVSPVLVGSHDLPSTGTSSITLTGTPGNHDGNIRLSSDGNYLTLAGYRADAGALNPQNNSAATSPRVIGLVSNNWSVDTTTALTDAYNNVPISAVVTDNGQRFWVGGSNASDATSTVADSGGLRYVSHVGATTSTNIGQTQFTGAASGLQPDSLRNLAIINKQLYITTASQGSYGNRGLYKTTDAFPVSGPQTMIPVMNNIEGGSGTSGKGQQLAADNTGKLVPKSDIVYADLSAAVPGYDTAYSTGGKAEYEKWSLISGSWQTVGVYNITGSADIDALDISVDANGKVSLFAATAVGVYRFTDSGGYVGSQPSAAAGTFAVNGATYYINADSNDEFRGIAMVPEPSVVGILGLGVISVLARRRGSRRQLTV